MCAHMLKHLAWHLALHYMCWSICVLVVSFELDYCDYQLCVHAWLTLWLRLTTTEHWLLCSNQPFDFLQRYWFMLLIWFPLSLLFALCACRGLLFLFGLATLCKTTWFVEVLYVKKDRCGNIYLNMCATFGPCQQSNIVGVLRITFCSPCQQASRPIL